jgi:hypothetical protein
VISVTGGRKFHKVDYKDAESAQPDALGLAACNATGWTLTQERIEETRSCDFNALSQLPKLRRGDFYRPLDAFLGFAALLLTHCPWKIPLLRTVDCST